MSNYYFLKEIEIEDGCLAPTQIEEAKEQLPKEFSVESNGTSILMISKTLAHVTFKCNKKSKVVVGVSKRSSF